MNALTDRFLINGKPMLAPDADVAVSYSDLDSADSGRDESGYMHRIVARQKVASWSFVYSHLTQQEYAYMLSILPQSGSFTFTHPRLTEPAATEDTDAYLSQYSIVWHNAKTGEFRNLKFHIIQC